MIALSDRLWLLAIALVLSAFLGERAAAWRSVPHPELLLRRLAWLVGRRARQAGGAARQRAAGLVAWSLLVVPAIALAAVAEGLLAGIPYGGWAIALLAALFLPGTAVLLVLPALAAAGRADGLPGLRRRVALLARRDPDDLDESAAVRAAIGAVAERFASGLVAPAFWFALLGLPGLAAFAAIRAAATMVRADGRQGGFDGWPRLAEGVVLLPGNRLGAFLLALASPLAGGRPGTALTTAMAEARTHPAPAAWPIAALAGGLGIALGGSYRFGGRLVAEPWLLADGRKESAIADLGRAARVVAGAGLLLLALVVLGATSL